MSEEAEHEVDEAAADMGDKIADMEHHLEHLEEEIDEVKAEDRHMQESQGIPGLAGNSAEANEGEGAG
jgi:prefoldin subunit 5